MSYDYIAKQNKFAEKALKYGFAVKFNYEDPVRVVTDYVIAAENDSATMSNQGAGGSLIQVVKKNITVLLSGASAYKPVIGGTMLAGKLTYRILTVDPVAPGGVAIFYRIGLST